MFRSAAWTFRRLPGASAWERDSWNRSSAGPDRPADCASTAASTEVSCRWRMSGFGVMGPRGRLGDVSEGVGGRPVAPGAVELVVDVTVDLAAIVGGEPAIRVDERLLARGQRVPAARRLLV